MECVREDIGLLHKQSQLCITQPRLHKPRVRGKRAAVLVVMAMRHDWCGPPESWRVECHAERNHHDRRDVLYRCLISGQLDLFFRHSPRRPRNKVRCIQAYPNSGPDRVQPCQPRASTALGIQPARHFGTAEWTLGGLPCSLAWPLEASCQRGSCLPKESQENRRNPWTGQSAVASQGLWLAFGWGGSVPSIVDLQAHQPSNGRAR